MEKPAYKFYINGKEITPQFIDENTIKFIGDVEIGNEEMRVGFCREKVDATFINTPYLYGTNEIGGWVFTANPCYEPQYKVIQYRKTEKVRWLDEWIIRDTLTNGIPPYETRFSAN